MKYCWYLSPVVIKNTLTFYAVPDPAAAFFDSSWAADGLDAPAAILEGMLDAEMKERLKSLSLSLGASLSKSCMRNS